MSEKKYAHHIITQPRMSPLPASAGPMLVQIPEEAEDLSSMHRLTDEQIDQRLKVSKMTRLLWLDDEMLKGASYTDFVWCNEASDSGPGPHTHEFDEVLGFLGTNPDDPRDLGGEIELWLEDEKYLITKTCLVFVPKGMKHCPLIARKVDRPFIQFSFGPGAEYVKTSKA